ncbi:hypothetical protein ZWY2020_051153 [Hordeum vulgare]|nr:hypothetical protein ZWY2020_051153 [Hordeum vulgare]
MRRIAVSCSASGPADEEGMTYKGAGVDIDAGTKLVCRIRKLAPGIGFGGLYPHSALLIFLLVFLVKSTKRMPRGPPPADAPTRRSGHVASLPEQPKHRSARGMVYTRLSFPPPPADQRHHGVAADRQDSAPRPTRPRPRAMPASPTLAPPSSSGRLGKLPSRKSRAAVSTTRSPGLGNAGNLREVRSCKDAGILV